MQEESTAPEAWRPVVGYEGWYSVSSYGRVRRDRAAPGAQVGYVLRQRVDVRGYWCIRLTCDAVMTRSRVHRLVAAAFLGPRADGHEVNHIDGVKTNNHVDNLEYVSHLVNQTHASRLGLYRRGDAIRTAKLTEQDVLAIRASTAQSRALARQYGVGERQIWLIRSGRSWKHLLTPR